MMMMNSVFLHSSNNSLHSTTRCPVFFSHRLSLRASSGPHLRHMATVMGCASPGQGELVR